MILDVIVADKKKRLLEQKKVISPEKMKELALCCDRKCISFYDALAKKGLSVIGEFKNASPSHGTMNNKIDLKERIVQYTNSADAISCLTEENHFHGSVEYLKKIRTLTDLPIIRKDFIIDPYQVYEAKVIGADAILLIAAILTDEAFKMLYELAYELGMDVLCEVHDAIEMQRMLDLDVRIIGINNRDLKTFEVNLDTTKRLAGMAAESMKNQRKLLVSESGVSNGADIERIAQSGADAVLIGTVLMEADQPEKLVAQFKEIYDRERNVEIKICGIRCKQDVQTLIEYGADYGGMVLFYPKSRRNLELSKAKELVLLLKKTDIKAVAVTVSPDLKQLEQIEAAGFDAIQIHGKLEEKVYEKASIEIIRAFNVKEENTFYDLQNDLKETLKKEKISYVLLDAGEPGGGKTFSWLDIKETLKNVLMDNTHRIKLVIAGGLNAENVRCAIDTFAPDVVDVSTGVEEKDCNHKSPELVRDFIEAVKKR